MRAISGLLFCLAVTVSSFPPASAATINVVSGGSLQTAIDNASNGDTIVVGTGTYTSPFNFKGKAITVRSTAPTNASVVANTKLVGPGDAPVVMFNHGESTTSKLMGFTISGGRWSHGGGIVCDGAGPTISDNRIIQNQATVNGGGIFVSGSVPPVIVRNIIADNTAAGFGGGIYIGSTADPQAAPGDNLNLPVQTKAVTSATIRDNTIVDNTAVYGGGIMTYALEPAISGDIIARNTAEYAGGLMLMGYTPTVTNCTIVGNSATHSGPQPAVGGLMAYASDAAVINCIIANNLNGGIGSIGTQTVPQMKYCDVYGNSVADYSVFPSQTGTNGNISRPPAFANLGSGDYHLQSCNGRWDPNTSKWVKDITTSPCIDAGDPASVATNEPQPNGGPIELGAYGNRGQASRSSMFASRAPYGSAIARLTQIQLSFLRPVKRPSAQAHFTLTPSGGSAGPGTFTWGATGSRLIFTPLIPLQKLKQYTATCSAGIVRNDGTTINWSESTEFTTGGEPVVLLSRPNYTGVWRGTSIKVQFDQPMARPTVVSAFSIYPAVTGTFSWVGYEMTFKPSSLLSATTTYEVTIGKNARSYALLPLSRPYKWSFTTGTNALPIPQVTACATASGAQLTVSLTDAAAVSASICNLAGREIALLPEQSLPPGTSTLLWSGKSRSGTTVPAGQYWVKVTARDGDGSQKQTVAPLQLR